MLTLCCCIIFLVAYAAFQSPYPNIKTKDHNLINLLGAEGFRIIYTAQQYQRHFIKAYDNYEVRNELKSLNKDLSILYSIIIRFMVYKDIYIISNEITALTKLASLLPYT